MWINIGNEIEGVIDVVIPTRPSDIEMAIKAGIAHKERANAKCNVYVIVDYEKKGWVAMQNMAFKQLKNPYYVFSCADCIPGRNWLKIGFESLEEKEIYKLLAFNDGKWHGHIATSGLIDRSWTKELFHSGYKNHYADTELSDKAVRDNVMCYNPNALLVENDLDKERKSVDKTDKELYLKRTEGFGRFRG